MDNIQNWYRSRVFDKIRELAVDLDYAGITDDPDLWPDIACLALNNLPPKYVRHEVDTTFYLTQAELFDLDQRVTTAVKNAMNYVVTAGSDVHERPQ